MPSVEELASSSPSVSTSEDSLSYYKAQYEQLEAELADFQASSRELEAELERDVEASEKRERKLQEKVEGLGYEVEEWKTKYKQSKAEANAAQNTLQKEITTLRDTGRTMQMKLRDIEVVNDDFERQARNTTSSLEDLESKYNISIERGVMVEEEIRAGEQEREALRIETQRLRDELSDLRVEAEIRQDKLRHAEAVAEKQRFRKPAPLDPGIGRSQSPISEHSPTTSTSSPTITTPPTKSASSTISETPTPPSPPTSENSLPPTLATPGPSVPKPRLSTADPHVTPRALSYSSRPPRHSRGPSIPMVNDRSTPSMARRSTLNRQENQQNVPGIPSSGSLHQIRGLIGKMQKLEQRVNSARSKLPAPTFTPPHGSPRSNSALGQSHIPNTVTMRSAKRRTGGSNASAALKSPSETRPISRLSFGYPQPSPSRDPNNTATMGSRPNSRASISSRTSLNHLPNATPSNPTTSRPSSRQSVSGARTPLGHYATSTQSESRRPRSSLAGSYSTTHQAPSHGHSASVSRLSNYNPIPSEDAEEENASEVLTPTPSRRTTFGKGVDVLGSSGIPALSKTRMSGLGAGAVGRRISSGPGDMGPPEKRAGRKLSGVGETF